MIFFTRHRLPVIARSYQFFLSATSAARCQKRFFFHTCRASSFMQIQKSAMMSSLTTKSRSVSETCRPKLR